MRLSRWMLCAFVLGSLASSVIFTVEPLKAQGLLLIDEERRPIPLPRPIITPDRESENYWIKTLGVHAKITDQVAETQVTQSFFNPGSRVLDASFIFPLPDDAAIQELTLLVDGKEFQGNILPKEEARRIYESYVRRSKDPALLEWMGSGMFQTRVFPIPPGATRTVTMKYSQVLRKYDRMTDYLVPLATAKYTTRPIEQLDFQITIESKENLKTIYSPAFPIEISRTGEHLASVKVHQEQTIPSSDFRLLFDTSGQSISASLLSHWPTDDTEGYFMLLASPEFKQATQEALPKDMVFVVDRSGSMTGKKIDQVKESLRFVINQLNVGDRFNIVSYSSDIDTFKPELLALDPTVREQALGYVEGLYAGGSTHISGALETAFGLLAGSDRPQYIVFLTDGLPTAGVTQEAKIVEMTRKANQSRARLLSLGVGYDVNSRLLDRLTHQNRGQTEYVRPEESIETYISRLYSRIASPVLTDIKIEFLNRQRDVAEGALVNRVYPSDLPDLFQREQLVVAGRYKAAGEVVVRIRGNVGAEEKIFDFPLSLSAAGTMHTHPFVERIWASRRIGEIIDELDLNGNNPELVEELVKLSTRYGILTPYTSFLADDQSPEGVAFQNQVEQAGQQIRRLEEVDGISGVSQRQSKADFKRAGGTTPNAPGAGGLARPSLAIQSQAAFGGAVYRDIDEDRAVVSNQVLTVGPTTLYQRGVYWVANNVGGIDLNHLPEHMKRIERFSDAYFDLASKNTREENVVLSRVADEGKLLIQLRGQLYLIE